MKGALSKIRDPRLALLGAGGLGKTSIATAFVNDPFTIERFGDNRHWIACDIAEKPELLIQNLAYTFNIKLQPNAKSLQQIVKAIRSSPSEHLLVLDNLETLLDNDGYRQGTENILLHLASLSNLALLITKRSIQLPSGINWTRRRLPLVGPLDVQAARQAFVTAHDLEDESLDLEDGSLDDLLCELDLVPLAITLIATAGQSPERTPTELLKSLRSRRSKMLQIHAGRKDVKDRMSSIAVSVQVSLESPRLQSIPECLRLLSAIASLPGGIDYDHLEEIFPSVPTIMDAADALVQASLLQDS